MLLQQAVPEISGVLYSTREALLQLRAINHSTVQQQLAALMASLNVLAASKITISMPGELIVTPHTPQVSLLSFDWICTNYSPFSPIDRPSTAAVLCPSSHQ